MAVLELEATSSGARRRITDECRQARNEDGAGVIVLGCAGMSHLADDIQAAVGIPVIDGVGIAVRFAEPLPKTFSGRYAHWSR